MDVLRIPRQNRAFAPPRAAHFSPTRPIKRLPIRNQKLPKISVESRIIV